MKRKISILLPLLVLSFLVFTGRPVKAAGEFKLDKTSYTFNASSSTYEDFHLPSESDYDVETGVETFPEEIKSVVSSNSKVAKLSEYDSYYFEVKPVGVGSCIFTVTGKNGSIATLNVKVTDAYMKAQFVESVLLSGGYYGSKKMVVSAPNGTSGKVVVGKKTYKYGKSEKATIKLKKVYKLNTKYVLTAKKGKYSCTKKGKIYADTYIYDGKIVGKKIKLRILNLHKGDVVSIKYKGKTYKKVIKKNKDQKFTTVTFKMKKKVKKNTTINYTVKNKDKKKLEKNKLKFNKGLYDAGFC